MRYQNRVRLRLWTSMKRAFANGVHNVHSMKLHSVCHQLFSPGSKPLFYSYLDSWRDPTAGEPNVSRMLKNGKHEVISMLFCRVVVFVGFVTRSSVHPLALAQVHHPRSCRTTPPIRLSRMCSPHHQSTLRAVCLRPRLAGHPLQRSPS